MTKWELEYCKWAMKKSELVSKTMGRLKYCSQMFLHSATRDYIIGCKLQLLFIAIYM